ncbi:hypothetical protein GTO89_16535 [Heliobacterium gestii]|uniref:Uncharacterized protein n=1 Tax=Heliomicrobium gestii TaxID=2699 RepID=A0A845LHX4_HELGE|nr:hypothetical protein [Heliomicrobium gestii]MBM7867315.1 hypothetical protein [Heliomicrobium gestii]MZP44630.1 hypothetical protein [Heliomicrobium gestii]
MDLRKQFHEDMVNVYIQAKKEAKYNATRFLQMVSEKGGYEAAKILISKDAPSDGFTKLYEAGKLNLSVEALILREKYVSLFTDDERKVCSERLETYRYKPK